MSHAVKGRPTHRDAGHDWALVLAAGEGSRLQTLTTTASGIAVPKQFCSLGGGTSLLHDALRRARAVVPAERTCAVVAEHHRLWWQALPRSIPARNIVVQPWNRGTGNGILLPLLQIIHRDPQASLLVLPSDHYVRNEALLATSLRQVMAQVGARPQHLVLLGLSPEEADPELGYIVPDAAAGRALREVSRFVEKPSIAMARALIERGGLWNAFIFAANGRMLVRAFEAHCPDIVAGMRSILTDTGDDAARQARLAQLYAALPSLDFSRDIVALNAPRLRVLTVPACGWSDLGTPRRVAAAVDRDGVMPRGLSPAVHAQGFLDLAAQHARLQATG